MRSLGIAVIGAGGWIGGVHSECWTRMRHMLPGARVTLQTAVDIVPANARRAAETYGFARWTADYREAIRDPAVDIVDICCSNRFHREVAVAAAQAGKHILCEKPLAVEVADARAMVEAAERAGVVAACNLIYRKYPGVAYIKGLLDAGELGRPYYIRGAIEQDSHSDPDDTHAWLFSMDQAGGGTIVTNGTHLLDLSRYLLGEFAELTAHSETFIRERPAVAAGEAGKAGSLTFGGERPPTSGERIRVDVDDVTAVLARFRRGGFGSLLSSWVTQGTRHNLGFELVCSGGGAAFDTQRLNEVRLYQNRQNPGDRDKIGFTTVWLGNEHPYGELANMKTGFGIGGKDVFAILIKEFAEAVLTGGSVSPSFADGLRAVECLKAVQQSARERRWVGMEEG